MYIQNKLFSETGERYYSIIMTEREFSLWTKFKEEVRSRLQKSIIEDKKNIGSHMRKRLVAKRLILDSPKSEEIINDGLSRSNSVLFPRSVSGEEFPSTTFAGESNYLKYKKELAKGTYSPDDIVILTELMNANRDGKNQIFWNKSDGLETFVHEVGHQLVHETNFKDWLIKQNIKLGNRFKNSSNPVLKALFSVLMNENLVLTEQSASKKGYKMLKEHNLTKEELKLAKKNLDDAIVIYKLQRNKRWKSELLNSRLLSQ